MKKLLMKKLLMIVLALALSLAAIASEPVKLNPDNTVFLKDVVEADSVTKAMSELSKLENNTEPVLYLVLDTPGGSVFDGLNLIHFLKGFSKPVKTITIFSASMGFQIAEGNPGDRLIVDTGVLMSHPMSGGMRGELGAGMSAENRANYLKEVIKTMDEQVVKRTNGKQTLQSYVKAYDNELWTTGQSAVDAGYADAVVGVSCSSDLLATNEIVDEREYIGSGLSLEIKYEFSKCPLMLSVLKYQVTLVDLIKNKRFVLSNKGYEIPVEKQEKRFGLMDLFGDSSNPQKEVDRITAASKKYKILMMYLDRTTMRNNITNVL